MPMMACLICGAKIDMFGQDHQHDPVTGALLPYPPESAPVAEETPTDETTTEEGTASEAEEITAEPTEPESPITQSVEETTDL